MKEHDSLRFKRLHEIANSFNIKNFVFHGDLGTFMCAFADYTVAGTYVSKKSWNKNKIEFFQNSLSNGGTFLDIGSNIGLAFVPVAQNPKIQCIGFEPAPEIYKMLVQNIQWNCQHPNTKVMNIAIHHKNSEVNFDLGVHNFGDNRITSKHNKSLMMENRRKTITVDAKRLDDLGLTVGLPLAVKIDTQGAEPFVISGGEDTLGKADLIAIEFWPYSMSRLDADYRIVIEFLRRHFQTGFVLKGEDEDNFGAWKPIDNCIDLLEQCAQSAAQDPQNYLEVIAKKT